VSRTAPDNRRWRWRLAILLDRIPGMCWADLVTWALGWRRNPWARRTSVCRADEARNGCCYCGRYGPESPRAVAKRGTTAPSDDLPAALRRAAAEKRRRAEAATAGPWCCYRGDVWRGTAQPLAAYDADPDTAPWPYPNDDPGHIVAGDVSRAEDAEHIAGWHPGVAILVADLLDMIADESEAARPCADGCPNRGEMTWSWPLAECLAREYLRATSEPLAPAREADEPGRAPVSTVEEAG